MQINPNYKLVYEIGQGKVDLDSLDRYELVSVALCDPAKLSSYNRLGISIVNDARMLCVGRLKSWLELEWNAKLNAQDK